MLVKFSVRFLVLINMLINRLVVNLFDICYCKGRTDLLGTPWLFAKLELDLFQLFGGGPESLVVVDSLWRWVAA